MNFESSLVTFALLQGEKGKTGPHGDVGKPGGPVSHCLNNV